MRAKAAPSAASADWRGQTRLALIFVAAHLEPQLIDVAVAVAGLASRRHRMGASELSAGEPQVDTQSAARSSCAAFRWQQPEAS